LSKVELTYGSDEISSEAPAAAAKTPAAMALIRLAVAQVFAWPAGPIAWDR
jgi:hypothetical protein